MSDEQQGCDMAAWAEANKTNDHHAHLAKTVGEWKVLGKFWMGPGEPMETEGASTVESILDGRYVKHSYNSSFAGAPFSGLGIDGYDNAKEKYVSLWIDNMSTGFCLMEGFREENTITSFGTMPGMGGQVREVKSVSVYEDDSMTFSMFDKNGDTWTKNMELQYKRKA